jgi:protein-disulfide isomerase
MKFMPIAKTITLVATALLSTGATRMNWDASVAVNDGGHRIGNPDAKVKVTEFISYTCPHCAAFARSGEPALKLGYVAPGKVSLEIRHLIRDPIDLTAAMLASCGAAAKFPQNHAAFMLGQDNWIKPLTASNAAQQARWRTKGAAGRRAIASDFGFYRLMENRGYRRPEIDRCLADEKVAAAIAAKSAEDWKRPGIGGTPAFAINGNVMPGTHTWDALERQLKELL